MRKFILVLTLIIFILAAGTIVVAEEEDDGLSLCFDGTWHCPDPDNPEREEWNWTCGAYWGHHYAGLMTTDEIPEFCKPVEPQPVIDDSCYIHVGYFLGEPAYELATPAILNGADGGYFEWSTPTTLINL